MQCSKCQFDNPENMQFCGRCGSKLQNLCPECEFANPTDFQFCGKCGTRLTPEASEAALPHKLEDEQQGEEARLEPLSTERDVPEAERRRLTVLFCDLVGSTPLSDKLDPEELREVLHDYQSVCAKVIRRFDGHIARYFGDGILVYFGYPLAHEDDAQRAVRAGLGIVEAMVRLNARFQQEMGVRLQVRLGVHTGLVVAGDMDKNEQLEAMAIIGDTPNIAARLQGIAEPDTIVISDATHQLISGFFDCRSIGTPALRGIEKPMEVYHVLHESGARSRLDVAEITGLTPLVGREQEVGILIERWEQVKEGMGHVVLVGGEAGIGKSRLVQVLKEHVADEPQAWLTECRCSPYYQNTALYPIVELFERVVLQFDRGDSPPEKLSKVEGFLVQYGLPLYEAVPLFATLLSVPLGESYSPLHLTPQQQKQKTLQALLKILTERASQQPVLFVVEDLHWADASSLELLDLLVDQGPTVPIFTLLTFRPAFTPPWTGRSHLTYLTLNPLPPRQISDMVEHIAGKSLPTEVLKQVTAKTDGVPLFVEELTKMVLESVLLREREDHYELTGLLPPLAIPATLHDSLMVRLDRLAAVKELAQLGATLGREFSYEVLHAVSLLDEDTLQRALAQLVDAELLYQRGLPPQATYHFKHSLIRDAAYESLLKSRRQQYHQQIAQVLEEQFPEIAETQPEIVAHHYTAAGISEKAIPYWHQAGQQAIQRSANVEAISHLTQGLELLKTLPHTPQRDQQELGLQIALGPALIATKGMGVPEVEQAFSRARELCQKIEETPQLFPALWGLWGFYIMRAEFQMGRELGEQLLNLAQRQGDPALLLQAHRTLGPTLYYLGEFTPALEHLEQGIALYDAQQYRSLAFLYGVDPGGICLAFAALTLWHLGYPDQALRRSHDGLTLARERSHPHSLAYTLSYTAFFHHFRREARVAQERADEVISLSTDYGFWFSGFNQTIQGWALAEQGQVEEGIDQIEQGMAAWLTAGGEMLRPFFLGLLAEAYGKIGQNGKALRLLAEAMAAVEKTEERWWEAGLYRLKGELLLMQGESETEVEGYFQKAIELARRQQAKSLELRAVMSLSCLWQKQGRQEEALKMLAEIYGWFTEGFDTKDLKEAKALLEELSSN